MDQQRYEVADAVAVGSPVKVPAPQLLRLIVAVFDPVPVQTVE